MKKLFNILSEKSHILLIFWMTIIFIGSSIPGEDIPGDLPPDYVLHFLEYALLGFFSYLWVSSKIFTTNKVKALFFSFLIPSIFGIFDEFYQGFIPGRFKDPRDWLTDTLGGLFGAILCMLIFYYFYEKNGKTKAYQGNIKRS